MQLSQRLLTYAGSKGFSLDLDAESGVLSIYEKTEFSEPMCMYRVKPEDNFLYWHGTVYLDTAICRKLPQKIESETDLRGALSQLAAELRQAKD
ncbi:hypothetical protein ACI2KR_30470 [Pseudomonas luteola]